MLHLDVKDYNSSFLENLADWCAGGPKLGGWTRTGPPLALGGTYRIRYQTAMMLPVEEGLAKNAAEIRNWHLSFLKEPHPLTRTLYYKEYLRPRMGHAEAVVRAERFLDLLSSIKEKGVLPKQHACVVDIRDLNLGFRYFRFDGCHRMCCAKVANLSHYPTHVFTLLPATGA